MPLGLWKSRWERLIEETSRRDREWREETRVRYEEWREWRATSEARADERHQALIAKLDENGRNLEAALEPLVKEVVETRKEITLMRIEMTDSINALTEAVLRLIDRFDEFEGRRPPGRPPPLRPA